MHVFSQLLFQYNRLLGTYFKSTQTSSYFENYFITCDSIKRRRHTNIIKKTVYTMHATMCSADDNKYHK